MTNAREFALNLLSNNPQFAQNPQAQELINVIRQGDSVKGEQIATNLPRPVAAVVASSFIF